MEDFEPLAQNQPVDSNLSNKETPEGVQPAGVSTVPSTFLYSGGKQTETSFSSDYHLTVSLLVRLERREISLLLGVLSYQATHFGVTFPMYLCLLHLNEILIGNKIRASEIKDRYQRLSVELSQLIIRDLAGQELEFGRPLRLSEKTYKIIIQSKVLMTYDTYKSRVNHWRPENFLALKTVPVDVIIERSGNSVRYTSYCKGYGEGTGTARRGKTPSSFELDGEETPEWVLSEQLSAKELAQEVFLIAHFEWLKRFGSET